MMTTNKILFYFLPFITGILSIIGGYNVSEVLWSYEYEGKKTDEYIDVIEDNNGRIVALGNTHSIKHKGSDILISIFDNAGTKLKEKNIGAEGLDEAARIIQHKGHYFVIGRSNSEFEDTKGGYDAWIFSLDNNLNVSWSYFYGSKDDDGFVDILVNQQGNLVTVGYEGNNPIIYEFDTDGAKIRSNKLSKLGYFNTISEYDDKYYSSGNSCFQCDDDKTRAFTSEIDKSSLKEEWSDVLSDEFFGQAVDSEIIDGELIILGNVDIINAPRYQAAIARYYLKDNSFIDYKEFGGKWDDLATRLYYDRSTERIYISGKSKSFSKAKKEEYKAWQLVLDSDYKELESSYEGTIHYDTYSSHLITSENYAVFVGQKNKNAWIQVYDTGNKTSNSEPTELLEVKQIVFADQGGNQYLNHSETGYIKLVLTNNSKETLNNVRVCFDNQALLDNDIAIPPCYIIKILKSGQKENVSVELSSGKDLTTGSYNIPITINAANVGSVTIQTQERQYVDLNHKKVGINHITNPDLSGEFELTYTVQNLGNLASGEVVGTIKASKNILLLTEKIAFSLNPKEKKDLTIRFKVEHNAVSVDPILYFSLDQNSQDATLEFKEPINISGYQSEVDGRIEIQEQERQEKAEQARLEKIKQERQTELAEIKNIKTMISDSINLLAAGKSNLTARLNERLTILALEETTIFKKDYTEVIEDHTFIRPYILDDYLETYDDLQEIILLLDHEEDFEFEQLSLTLNGQPIVAGIDYLEDDLSIDIKQKGNSLKIEYRNRIRLHTGSNEIAFVATYGGESYQPTTPIIVEKKIQMSKLHLISIGVPDHSQTKDYRLKYTSKDAEDLVALFSDDRLESYFNTTVDLFSTSENTSSAQIKTKIQKLNKADYNPEDLLIFYISSHAFYSEDFGELFVSTSDYDFLNAEASSLRFNSDILDWLKRLPCNVILLLDICHSGHIINEAELEEGASEATSLIINHLNTANKKASHINVISSSGAGEYSYEIDKLGNSAFMAAIKEAIANQVHSCFGQEITADIDKSRSLQLNEFIDFIRQRVPCLIEEYKEGQAQNPSAVITSEIDLKIFPEL